MQWHRCVVVVLAALAIVLCATIPESNADERGHIVGDDTVRAEWLDEMITVAEAERRHPGLPNDERVRRFPEIRKPFGFLSAKWEALKERMQPGDELWTFASSAKSWEDLAGRAGIALVRDKRVIASIVTKMN